jgi:hypothetical protein
MPRSWRISAIDRSPRRTVKSSTFTEADGLEPVELED